jgi:uncharacterized cupredoxin-like copper-binding protein
VVVIGCSGSGEGGREVVITQTDDGCTPESIDVTTGEKLDLAGKNESSQTYELEGTNGTEFEEILIPEGKTRSAGFTVPDEEGTYDIKCYQPGGESTIVALVATSDGSGGEAGPANNEEDEDELEIVGGNDDPADDSVDVKLSEYKVAITKSAAAAGNIQFATTNASGNQTHELAILRVEDDGSKEVVGEIEDIPAGVSGSINLDLEAGTYELACLIVPGEAGSTTDHYEEGMHTDFTVE